MEVFEFDSMDEFDVMFDSDNASSVRRITQAIHSGIDEAYRNGQSKANLFSVSFVSSDEALDIVLNKSQWTLALTNCRDKYHTLEMYDEAIEVHNLITKLSDGGEEGDDREA